MDQAKVIFKVPLFDKQQDKYVLKNTETGLDCGKGLFFPWNVSELNFGSDTKLQTLYLDKPCREHIGMIQRDFSFKYRDKLKWNLTSWDEKIRKKDKKIGKEWVVKKNEKLFYQNQCEVNCTSNTNICYSKNEECDQMCQCPECEDEYFDKCKDSFPATATEECLKADTNDNTTIVIKATPCNNVAECKEESDEKKCKDENDMVILIILGVSALVILISAWMKIGQISWYWEKVVSHVRAGIYQELTEGAHGQQSLTSFVVSQQGTNHRKVTNLQFFKWELAHHGNNKAETFACIKDHFDPNTCKNVLEDAPLPKSCWSKTMDMATSW